jgi:hypothetical protein
MRVAIHPPRRPAPRSAAAAPARRTSFAAVLDERMAAGPRPPPVRAETARGAAAPAAAAPAAVGRARAWLERVARAESEIDALLEAAARGKTFSPGELLALEAGVFRYAQTVEIVSRVTDRLVGAVKQTLGAQT